MPQAFWSNFASNTVFFARQQMHSFDLSLDTRTRNPKVEVPYSDAALRQDLQRIRTLWDHSQANRQRDAIYGYLAAVYALVTWWAADGRETDRFRRAMRLVQLEASDREDPFTAIIRCTADPVKADQRTRASGLG
jgi:hypothetical protein